MPVERGARLDAGRPQVRSSSAPRWQALLAAAAILVPAVVWLVGPTVSFSDSDFGSVTLDGTGFGSTVAISTPASTLFQAPDEFVVHRTFVQSRNSQPGLIQAGIFRSGSEIALDNCGAHAGYVVFTEVRAANSMAYRCQLFGEVAPGTAVSLDLYRFHTPASWGIRLNGVPTGQVYQLGFSKGDPAVGTEIQSLGATHATHTATRYGPAGRAAWSVYRAPARASPHRVTGSEASTSGDDPFWSFRGPPSRVTIRHR